jgi:putative transcriptional regulator
VPQRHRLVLTAFSRPGDTLDAVMAETLRGRLLVASPALRDPNFDRTVVLLLEHTEEGALGVVLNRPSELDLAEALPEWGGLALDPAVVFVGGPVQTGSLIGLAAAWTDAQVEGWTPLIGRVGAVDLEHPDALAPGVGEVRIFSGYAGWGAGQLEGELEVGAWFVLDAAPDDAFSPQPDRLWRTVLRRQGGRMALMAGYPEDPELN